MKANSADDISRNRMGCPALNSIKNPTAIDDDLCCDLQFSTLCRF